MIETKGWPEREPVEESVYMQLFDIPGLYKLLYTSISLLRDMEQVNVASLYYYIVLPCSLNLCCYS
jgi:hypothetical protein